jgi:hypothetical protein
MGPCSHHNCASSNSQEVYGYNRNWATTFASSLRRKINGALYMSVLNDMCFLLPKPPPHHFAACRPFNIPAHPVDCLPVGMHLCAYWVYMRDGEHQKKVTLDAEEKKGKDREGEKEGEREQERGGKEGGKRDRVEAHQQLGREERVKGTRLLRPRSSLASTVAAMAWPGWPAPAPLEG